MALKPIGILIKQYRKEKKISQIYLATMIGSTQPFMCQLEKGNKSPSIEMLEKIATALEQPMAAFLIDVNSGLSEADKLLLKVMKLKQLWLYPTNTKEEHIGEARAMQQMHNDIENYLQKKIKR